MTAPGPWHDHQLCAPHTPQPTTKTRRHFVSVCSPYLTVSQSGFKSTRVTIQGWQQWLSLPRRTPNNAVKWGSYRTSGSALRQHRLIGVELSQAATIAKVTKESHFFCLSLKLSCVLRNQLARPSQAYYPATLYQPCGPRCTRLSHWKVGQQPMIIRPSILTRSLVNRPAYSQAYINRPFQTLSTTTGPTLMQ